MSTITDPHLRNRTTQDEILLAFADRLRINPLLNTENVVISDQSVPEQFPSGRFCIVVAPGDGRFPGELTAAASHAQLVEDGHIVVAAYSHIRRDRRGRSESKLLGRKAQDDAIPDQKWPSLVRWKQEILRLLMVGDPSFTLPEGVASNFGVHTWEPSKSGIPLLVEPHVPISTTGVLDVPGHDGWIGFQITYSVVWAWDLYTDYLTITPDP